LSGGGLIHGELSLIVSHLLTSSLPAFWFWQEQVAQQTNDLVGLLWRASPIAKLVLLVLLLFSIASWAIIFAKGRTTKKAQRQSAQFLQVFEHSRRWADLYSKTSTFDRSPLTSIFLAANEELQKQPRLNLEAVQRVMQSATIDETTKLERSLGWLASCASASPFIGLFGTVVGIILAFQGLSQASTASIQAVAPGIAEALIATAAGIAAAIPAVLGYNHYLYRVKILAAEMDRFSLQLLNFIEREASSYAQGSRSERVSG
jgi:biopolymer transport protein TolQ